MYDAGNIAASISLNFAQFSKGVSQVSSQTSSLANQLSTTFGNGPQRQIDRLAQSTENFNRELMNVDRIVSGILISQAFYQGARAIREATGALFEFVGNMEKAQIALEYFLGTPERAAGFLETMKEFAADTAFNTEQALTLSRRLMSAQFDPRQVKGMMTILNDASAATGGTADQLDRIVLALTQLRTNGTIKGQELRQFAEAGIPIYQILNEELGLTTEQLADIGELKIDGDLGVGAVLKGLERRYKGAADRIADTVPGMFETIRDSALMIGDQMISGFYAKYKSVVTTVRDFMEEIRNISTRSGIGGVFEHLVPKDLQEPIRMVIASMQSLMQSARQMAAAFGPSLQIVAESALTITAYVLPAIARLTQYIAAITHAAMTTSPWLRVLAASIIGLLVANTVGRALLFLWKIMRIGYIAAAVAKAVLFLRNALFALSLVLAKGPYRLVMILAGAMVALALSSQKAQEWISRVFGTLGKIMGLDIDTSDILKPIESDVLDSADEFNKDLEDMYDGLGGVGKEIEDTGKEADKAGKKVKDKFVAAFDEVFQVPDKLDEVNDILDGIAGTPLDEIKLPGLEDGKLPDTKLPEIKLPEIKIPDIDLPDWMIPGKNFWDKIKKIRFPPFDGTAFQESLEWIRQRFKEFSLEMKRVWDWNVKTIEDWVPRALNPIRDWVNETGKNLWDWGANANEIIKDWTKNTGNALNGWAVETGYKVKEWANNTGNSIKEWATNTGNNIRDWTVNTGNALNGWAVNTGLTLADWAVKAYDSVSGWTVNTGLSLANWALETGMTVANWAADGLIKLTEWAVQGASSVANWALETGGTFATWAVETGVTFANWVAENAPKLGNWALDTGQRFLQWSFDQTENFRTWSLVTGGIIAAWVGATALGLTKWGSNTLSTISKWGIDAGLKLSAWATTASGTIATWAATAGATVATWATRAYGTISTWVANTATSLAGWATRTSSTLYTWAATQSTNIATWATRVRNTIVTWSTNTQADFKTWSTNVRNNLATWATNVTERFAKWSSDVKTTVSSWSLKTGSDIKQWTTTTALNISSWVTTTSLNFVKWSTATATTIATWTKTTAKNVYNWASNTAKNIGSWVTNTSTNIRTWATTGIRNTGEWVNVTSRNIANWVTGTAGGISKWTNNVLGNFGAFANGAAGSIANWADSSWSNISRWLTGTASGIYSWAKNSLGIIADWARSAWDAISSIAKAAGNTVAGMFGGVNESIRNASSSIGSWASSNKSWLVPVGVGAVAAGAIVAGAATGGMAVPAIASLGLLALETGGIVDQDQIVRIGEGNKREAVIPLQNSSYMAPFSKAVAQDLYNLQGGSNKSSGGGDQPIMYVGTLIADDRSLKELERRMEVVRMSEKARGGNL